MTELNINPRDEAEIVASHLAVLHEEELFNSWDSVELRIRLGEIVMTGELTLDEMTTIISRT